MIRSMTGYGRSERSGEARRITVEIKSVNNRYLDIGIKMPRQLNPIEARIRAELKKYMVRGKVDAFISYEDLAESNLTVRFNERIARQYWEGIVRMESGLGVPNDVGAAALARFPDVFTIEEEAMDPEGVWEDIRDAIGEAAGAFDAARLREGAFLQKDLLDKLAEMESHVDFIEKKAPAIVEAYRDNLRARVAELLEASAIEEARIAQEVTLYADKVSVDEELVRLRSHIGATREELLKEGSIGRKLDFIAQEMNRESNTILSKTDDREAADHAIELKTLVEKIREQVQNIE